MFSLDGDGDGPMDGFLWSGPQIWQNFNKTPGTPAFWMYASHPSVNNPTHGLKVEEFAMC